MEWKNTLLMPKTDFQMKASLTTKEPEFRAFWDRNNIYEKNLEINNKNERFFLHDGPPYANGSLHVGHALNKILKDIIVRNKNMMGYYTPFVYGWDTHGLPIENKILSELNMTKDDLDPIQLRIKAEEYAEKQIEIQAEQFKSMSLFANIDNKYITLDKEFEVNQLKLLKDMLLKGIAYKGLKPVFWSPSSQSALAEAEVEYKDHMSPQVIVGFTISKGNSLLEKGDKLLIMTTTPWTFIANSGVAVGRNFNYDLISTNKGRFVVASQLTKEVMEKSKIEDYKIIKTFQGKDIEGVLYIRPIKNNLEAKVVIGHHVSVESGTGLVHLAPLFGEDDYIIGKKNDLDMIMHVDNKGYLNEEAGEFVGKFYSDANKDIGLLLDSQGNMLSLKFLKHSYPHDWRTGKPVIYRGVPQWFVSIKEFKSKILESLKKVKSNPEWGIKRISDMIQNRDEWTISRQRTWGVPIIVFYDKEGNPVIEEKIFDHVINLVAEHGTNVWWQKTADELLPKEYINKGYTKEMDIMDVWFDSGTTHITPQTRGNVLSNLGGSKEVYLEGSDQYRGWFNSSLINSFIHRKDTPYKHLISHGFVVDGKQQKMSKSKGNVIDPLKIISKNGAEILRMWAANSEYTSDITISDEIIKQNIEIYRRIRNTIKFMLGNLFDFKKTDSVKLEEVHKYASEKINNFGHNASKNFAKYKFQLVIKDLNQLLLDFSGFYFDFSKDTLYVEKFDNHERRSVQTNIYNMLDIVLKVIAPILPVTAEEAYQLFDKENKEESIFMERYEPLELATSEEEKWKEFFLLKEEIYKLLEVSKKEGKIKRNNEAKVMIKHKSDFTKNLNLQKLLMVGFVEEADENKVVSFESQKCERCWNHFKIGTLTNQNICFRCNEVISK